MCHVRIVLNYNHYWWPAHAAAHLTVYVRFSVYVSFSVVYSMNSEVRVLISQRDTFD